MRVPAWIVALVPYPLVWWGASHLIDPAAGPLAAGLLWWLDLQIESFTRRAR